MRGSSSCTTEARTIEGREVKLALLIILAVPAFAQNAYYGSIAALIAGQSADAYTTLRPNPGVVEFNPLGPRGVVIEKIVATSLLLGVEWVVARHDAKRLRKFAWLNYAMGGMFAGFAIHDWRLS